ncbi:MULTISPECIES: hypothetical protein [Pseudomonas]|uniref:hypothetical protein n=1 Tax=Pseudomonas guariconensis TaxID=1288410 RepID=UPI0020983B4D|nr:MULTISPECIES: hypothetical protein [Pseudomonas]MCO7595040.1 hypothetical protein [Pseudomonas guariconensis]MCU7221081.1 hypothetical protein [Pseudomonas brassicacearum]
MNIDKKEIKAIALACDPTKCSDEAEEDHRLAEFYSELTPETALALLAEIEHADVRLHEVATLCATVEQERDQLKAENQMLRDEDLKWQGLREQEAEIERLKAENEALRNDSERYRWLRKKDWIQVEVDVRCGESETLTEMDAVIDAAMTKEASYG